MIELTGLFGLLIFLFDLWAVVSVVGSDATVFVKLLWVLIVLLLPLIGFLIWVIVGPRSAKA
jgi:Phospholipase_D-nuclease N-terminal